VATDRVERARHRIQALAAETPDGAEYRDGVLQLLRDVVPWDAAVLTQFDPVTTLPTAGTGLGVDLGDCRTALELEFLHDDVDHWSDLAHDTTGVAVLSRSVGGDSMRSVRYRDLYRGQGWRDELRAAFRRGGACWGGVSLLREGRQEFTDDDMSGMAALGDVIAGGLRVLLLRGMAHAVGERRVTGPAVIVIGADGSIEGGTTEALHLLSRAGQHRPGDAGLLSPVLGVVSRQRASAEGVVRVRLRALDGGWLVLQAGPLQSDDGIPRTVVTIEPARPPEIISVIAATVGLTGRETVVLDNLVAGHSSVEIGRRLFLSPHTVNDHVRHIFEKTGVHTRKELLAWLFFSQYEPRPAAGPASATHRTKFDGAAP
jgi:DNA-binding CsgD family transcriptional regulator